jgi:hypothetical protein
MSEADAFLKEFTESRVVITSQVMDMEQRYRQRGRVGEPKGAKR